jgi:hypothetical protein
MNKFTLTVTLFLLAIVAFFWWGNYQPLCNSLLGKGALGIEGSILVAANIELQKRENLLGVEFPEIVEVEVVGYQTKDNITAGNFGREFYYYTALADDGQVGRSALGVYCKEDLYPYTESLGLNVTQ